MNAEPDAIILMNAAPDGYWLKLVRDKLTNSYTRERITHPFITKQSEIIK